MKKIVISVFSLAAMLWLTLSPAMALASSGCCGQQQSCCGHACCRNHR